MNILEVEDKIKGLPDQMLFKEAQMPSGSVPQFLVISEIQRRAKMRQGAKKPPTETVSDKVVQEGIASLMPPQQAPMAPQGIAQAGPQMGMNAPMAQQPRTSPAQPMMMASGGVTKMQTGGQPMVSPFGVAFNPQQADVGSLIDIMYNQQMQQAQAQREAAEQARARAEERGTSLQEQARKDAFNQALVGIGTGIARGDMAGGFAAGSQSAQERMREARQQALRASERGEALALSQEQAARQAELGAGTFGAQQRLDMMTRKGADLPASLQELAEARRIAADPTASETDKAWAAGIFGTREGSENRSLANFVNPDTGQSTLGVFGDDGIPRVYDPETRQLGATIPPNFVRTTQTVQATPADFATQDEGAQESLQGQITAVFGEKEDAPLSEGMGPLQQAYTRPLNFLSTALGLEPFDPAALEAANAIPMLARSLARSEAMDDETGRIIVKVYEGILDDMPTGATTDEEGRVKLRLVADRMANKADFYYDAATNTKFDEKTRQRNAILYQRIRSDLDRLLRAANPAAFASGASSAVNVGDSVDVGGGVTVRRVK